MSQKKLLLLGGSAQQVVAIRTAKEMGLYTILCDYLSDNPGQYEADKYYNVSTTDIEAVYNVALKEHIDGILAYASDPAALPAAIVAERLGLPANPSQSVAILGVKHKFRQFLRENNFACPKVHTFSPDEDVEMIKKAIKGFSLPIVVKPTDSSGSKGVTMLNDMGELKTAVDWADRHSRNKILIIEEFITRGFPYVIGGDIFVIDGKVALFGEMACLRDDEGKGNGLIPIGKIKPSKLNELQISNIRETLQRIITALSIRFGELNIEILLDKDDKVYILELGPRAGGNMIPIQLSDAFGVDLVRANIAVAMGEHPNLHFDERPGCFMHYVLHSYKSGSFVTVEYSDDIAPYIYRKVIYKKQGDPVEYFDGAGKALGIIFLHFDTVEMMDNFCRHHDEMIRIVLE